MENSVGPAWILKPFETALAGRRILITGHTGFTGGWAALWLSNIGAVLSGFSLPPEADPSLFGILNIRDRVETVFGDIADYEALHKAIRKFEPELILHLAAQPLVRRSYREPVRTFAVNALGTAHVLEAARHVKSVRAVVCITTDKVYQPNAHARPFRESDPLGGNDPYSASKAAAEMVIQSYLASYPWRDGSGPIVAVARGGNIVGGGDWSEDRLVPDFVRAQTTQRPLTLRFPDAVRPWQHVLALVEGYMRLLAGLISDDAARYARAWNLGPLDERTYSVRDALEMMARYWGMSPQLQLMDSPKPETLMLALDSSDAKSLLGWRPVWNTEQSLQATANWYRGYYDDSSSGHKLTLDQIVSWRMGVVN